MKEELEKKETERIASQTQMLAICQESGKDYDEATHKFLDQTLKMSSSKTVKVLDAKKENLRKIGVTMETQKEFDNIKELFGKTILDYKGLVTLCKEHTLFFGASSLFNGEIPPKAIKEAKDFDYVKARSYLKTLRQKENISVVDWPEYTGDSDLIIAAPITMFNLTDNKVIISNNEVVKCTGRFSLYRSKTCKANDPVLLMPFRAKGDGKVYFIVITNWE